VLGLSKKILIADVIGFQVDKILGPSNYDVLTSAQLSDIASKIANLDSTTAWIVILAFTFQIYFDFSGYSDMAIGLGRMLGFRFPENFDNPYVSTSISEFWRRWHQTFSVFIKNYLYFPLGGSRVKTEARKYFNLWFCFLVSGLWHGAAWNFVIYGALQGIFICADKLFLVKWMSKLGRIPSVIITFAIVVLTRCFFRIERIDLSWLFIKRLFAFDFVPFHFSDNPHFYTTMLIAAFFSFITLSKLGLRWQEKVYFTEYNNKQHIIAFVLSLFGFIFCLGALNATGFSPFIYFRF
jgi:alginate O-acetyltransferase complex protein AlgI